MSKVEKMTAKARLKGIGVLTSGGDCPGENAAIRALVRTCIDDYGTEVIGIAKGWRGLLDGLMSPLVHGDVYDILPRSGTVLGTSRTNP